jgi:hypothetical protein
MKISLDFSVSSLHQGKDESLSGMTKTNLCNNLENFSAYFLKKNKLPRKTINP